MQQTSRGHCFLKVFTFGPQVWDSSKIKRLFNVKIITSRLNSKLGSVNYRSLNQSTNTYFLPLHYRNSPLLSALFWKKIWLAELEHKYTGLFIRHPFSAGTMPMTTDTYFSVETSLSRNIQDPKPQLEPLKKPPWLG